MRAALNSRRERMPSWLVSSWVNWRAISGAAATSAFVKRPSLLVSAFLKAVLKPSWLLGAAVGAGLAACCTWGCLDAPSAGPGPMDWAPAVMPKHAAVNRSTLRASGLKMRRFWVMETSPSELNRTPFQPAIQRRASTLAARCLAHIFRRFGNTSQRGVRGALQRHNGPFFF